MADVDPHAPFHEAAEPLLDEEALWVHEAAARFEHTAAEELLEWALDRFHPRMAISAAGGVDGMAIIDMAWRINPDVRVFTLDTGRLPAGDLRALRGGPRALRHRRGVRGARRPGHLAADEPRGPEPDVPSRWTCAWPAATSARWSR